MSHSYMAFFDQEGLCLIDLIAFIFNPDKPGEF